MQANKRIDAGIPKGTREQRKQWRQEARKTPSSAVKVWTHYSPELRARAIQAAPGAILGGESTTQLAERLGVTPVTLRSWIVGSDDAEVARGALIAHELFTRQEQIDNAEDPLALARAREAFRAWSWIAERRESRLYGQHQQVTVNATVVDVSAILENARKLLDHVAERVVEEQQTEDVALLEAPEEPL